MPRTRRDSQDQNQDDETGVAIPLLQRDRTSFDRPPPRDTRFAISEEDAEAAGEDDDDEDGEIDARTTGPKYPPLPPSYREATFVRDPWYKSEVALSLQHYGRICFTGIWTWLKMYWPTSRFAQAGFFILGLWLLVVFSGPTWNSSSKLGWGNSMNDFLESIPPPPISGDGHFVSLAEWTLPSCRSTPSGLSTYCTRISSYTLTIPHNPDSFHTSDKIFLFIDPLREDNLSNGRGHVPASIEIKMDGSTKGGLREGNMGLGDNEIGVDIEARYEKDVEGLLTRANVGQMKAGLRDQGIGIYTWPLPKRLANAPKAIYPYPLLSFHITVHIQPNARIPNLRVEGAHVDAGLFTSLPTPTNASHSKTIKNARQERIDDLRERSPVELAGEAAERLKSARWGHPLANSRREISPRASNELVIGGIRMTTGEGSFSIGNTIPAMGRVWLQTNRGDIQVSPSSHLTGKELHLDTTLGDVTIGDDVKLESSNLAHLVSQHGDVKLGERVLISGTRVNGEAPLGHLDSAASSTIWKCNHTLILTSLYDLQANLDVAPPTNRAMLGVGTEQRMFVLVEATSHVGKLDIKFPQQARNSSLHFKGRAKRGLATIDLNREFQGDFDLKGGAGSSLVSPASLSDSANSRERVYSMEVKSTDPLAFHATGDVWWKTTRAGSGSVSPKGNADVWGTVDIEAEGVATLSFEQ